MTVVVGNGTLTDSAAFYWTVDPLVVIESVDDQLDVEGDAVSLNIIATEPGATLTYSATGLPAGLTIDDETGEISGTVAADQDGVFDVVVTVTDGTYASEVWFLWTIHHGDNTAPTLSGPGMQSNTVGDYVYLQIDAADSDHDTLTYSADGLPYGLWMDPETGVISGWVLESALEVAAHLITISVDDSNGGSASHSFGWSVNDSGLVLEVSENLTATAGTATDHLSVATFALGNSYWTQWHCQAAINWGDGTAIEEGIIAGSDGSFQIKGSHTYKHAGQYIVTIDVTNGFQFARRSGSIVVSSGVLNVTGGLTVGAAASLQVSGVVARFVGNPTLEGSEFSTSIDWGDGTTTTGTVTGMRGSFVVEGAHVYGTAGDFTITVTISDPDSSTNSATSTAKVRQLLAGIDASFEIATFQTLDPDSTEDHFVATISWGDGTSSSTTGQDVWITFASGEFTIFGAHTYAHDSHALQDHAYLIGVDVVGPFGDTLQANTTVSVTSPHVSGHGIVLYAEPEVEVVTQPVAFFVDSNQNNVAGYYSATIEWGDGSSSQGAVNGTNGVYKVIGDHEYTTAGLFVITVSVTQIWTGATVLAMVTQAHVGKVMDDLFEVTFDAGIEKRTMRTRVGGTTYIMRDYPAVDYLIHSVLSPVFGLTAAEVKLLKKLVLIKQLTPQDIQAAANAPEINNLLALILNLRKNTDTLRSIFVGSALKNNTYAITLPPAISGGGRITINFKDAADAMPGVQLFAALNPTISATMTNRYSLNPARIAQLSHELVHAIQIIRSKDFATSQGFDFLLDYGLKYLNNLGSANKQIAADAYRKIPYESEAYRLDSSITQLVNTAAGYKRFLAGYNRFRALDCILDPNDTDLLWLQAEIKRIYTMTKGP